mmetsp:Transcript_3219/g.9987  ORF Transcript_3219/g.9987 Transcript_3219/m.9987 type:complete len:259 (+) Transcript_3219:320-1096(+)
MLQLDKLKNKSLDRARSCDDNSTRISRELEPPHECLRNLRRPLEFQREDRPSNDRGRELASVNVSCHFDQGPRGHCGHDALTITEEQCKEWGNNRSLPTAHNHLVHQVMLLAFGVEERLDELELLLAEYNRRRELEYQVPGIDRCCIATSANRDARIRERSCGCTKRQLVFNPTFLTSWFTLAEHIRKRRDCRGGETTRHSSSFDHQSCDRSFEHATDVAFRIERGEISSVRAEKRSNDTCESNACLFACQLTDTVAV